MSNFQKNFKKDFSLGELYTQLEEYQLKIHKKGKALREESSLVKKIGPHKGNISAKNVVTKMEDRRQQPSYQESSVVNAKRASLAQFRPNSTIFSSIQNSKVTDIYKDKETGSTKIFTGQEQRKFLKGCQQIYGRSFSGKSDNIAGQIIKRDEVYHVLSQNLGLTPVSPENVEVFFKEYEQLQDIIQQFKKISQLDFEDIDELYFFLKTD